LEHKEEKEPAQLHTYSSAMCWAACNRLAKIAEGLNLKEKSKYWCLKARAIEEDIMKHIWNEELKSFVSNWDGKDVDPNLLLLPAIGFVSYKDERFLSTLKLIEEKLLKNGMILPHPTSTVANNFHTFSYIKCLNEMGRNEDARKLFEGMLCYLNSLGMLSETIDVETKEWWGNFPQNVALVGLINCAISLSIPWDN